MKKIILVFIMLAPVVFVACSKTCETEPIVEENHKLIVPPNLRAPQNKFVISLFYGIMYSDIEGRNHNE